MDTRIKHKPKISAPATISIDSRFKVLSWSNETSRILGYSNRQATGRLLHKLIIPSENHTEAKLILKQTLKAGHSNYKSWLLCKDGSMIFADISCRTIQTKKGQLKHVLMSLIDVTQQASLIDARTLKERYGTLLEAIPEGVVMVNLAGHIVLINSQAKKLFAYKKNNELIGETVEMLLPESLRKKHHGHRSLFNVKPVTRTLSEKKGLTGLSKNGREFPLEISLTPIQTETGLITMASIVDISQRKKDADEYGLAQLYLRTQFEISQVLSMASSFEELMPKLLTIICKNLNFSAGRVWEFDDENRSFQCVAGWIDKPKLLKTFQSNSLQLSIPMNSGIPGRVIKSRQPVWIESFSADPKYGKFPNELRFLSKKYNLEGAISFPILLNNNVKGVVTLLNRETLAFNQQLHDVLSSITNQIGQFLERRSQQNSITKLNRIYTVRSGINNAIVHVHDRSRLLKIACDIVITSGKFKTVWIGLLDETKSRVSEIYSSSRSNETNFLSKLDSFLKRKPHIEAVIKAIKGRQPLISNKLDGHDTIPLAKNALASGCRSALAMPFKVNSNPDGIIVIYSDERDFFDDDEVLLLKELANDISFAMQYIHNEEKLKFLAYRDPITGLNNRTALYSQLEETVTFNQEGNKAFALLLANMNNFRDINDTLGHQTGDELIRLVALRLSDIVWESDNVACLGGDNYAVLLHRLSNKEDISIVVNKIIRSFEESFLISDIPINVEVTIGIALFPDHGDSADLLWQHADVAIREARELDQTHLFYSKEIDHYDPLKLTLIGQLRKAIDNNDLILHYQPKIDLLKKHTVGVEALIRWQHPERGMIFPDNFIPLAEQTELINPLTLWVLENAMRQVLSWHKKGYVLDLAINLSARNLQYPLLVEKLLKIVSKLGFPLEKLLLEITETAIMSDPLNAGRQLAKLYDVGIQLSLDDFGIGQSSLTYLKDLPLKNMKIDKTFVMDIKQPSNYAIVRSAVELGHNMKFDVTAEGIEDMDSLGKLQKFKCNYGQGYYFSKPLPPEEFTIWLENTEWVYNKDSNS